MSKARMWMLALGIGLASQAYAETIQFADPLDLNTGSSLRFNQVSSGIGRYVWQTQESATKLSAPPLIESVQEILQGYLTRFPGLEMVEVIGDPEVKMEHLFGSVGGVRSSFAVISDRRHMRYEVPEAESTGLDDKKPTDAYAGLRLKF